MPTLPGFSDLQARLDWAPLHTYLPLQPENALSGIPSAVFPFPGHHNCLFWCPER